MDIGFYRLCCLAMLTTTVLLLALIFRETRRRPGPFALKHYVLVYVCLLAWQLCEVVHFSTHNPSLVRYIYDLRLVFQGLLALTTLLAVGEHTGYRRLLPAWALPAAALVPMVTTLLALFGRHHSLLTTDFRMLPQGELLSVSIVRGVWYYVHVAYCVAMLALVALMLLTHFRLMPTAYRGGIGAQLASAALVAAGGIFQALAPWSTLIDYTLISASLAAPLIYLSLMQGGYTGRLQIEQREIFNYMDMAVFVLDLEGRILDLNRPAKAWQALLEVDGTGENFDEFISRLRGAGKIVDKMAGVDADQLVESGGRPGDRYISSVQYHSIYRMLRLPLGDKVGTATGSFVVLEDVTQNRLFIKRLRNLAGVDSLTGLSSRNGYQLLLREVDQAQNLPLSVIMGDVNGLKRINDTYGHAMGDRLLVAVAQAIQTCCDSRYYCARIGGDEFVVVAPGLSRDQGEVLRTRIQLAVAGIQGLPVTPSIALGLAVKTEPDQNINTLIDRADMAMYSHKRD